MLALQLSSIVGTFLWALSFSGGACSNTSIQCSTLSALLPSKVSYPSSSTYIASILSYYWGQEHLTPACIVTPTTTLDVSIIVRALGVIHAANPGISSFAIRSGGHSPIAGAANINGNGVTIDLTSMDTISVNIGGTVASVGPGTLWNATYAKLDPMNITVGGGRVAGIGTGGFLTGGPFASICPSNRRWLTLYS